jgi:hypothetical protein
MQTKSVSKMVMVVALMVIACGLLASGKSALAQSNQTPTSGNDGNGQRCSNRTLNGSYAYSSNGQVLPAPGLSFPFTSTGIATFDGNGNVSWIEHTVVGGAQQGADWTSSTSGTYTVNADCTATAVVVTPNSPVPLHLFFSLVQQGKQLYSVVNGSAITGVWTRLN